MDKQYAEMVKNLAKPGVCIQEEMTPESAHLIHMVIGISGEAGELLDAIMAWAFGTVQMLDKSNVVEELGDLEFYLEGLRSSLGITRQECVDTPVTIHTPHYQMTPVQGSVWWGTQLSIAAANLLDLIKKVVIYGKSIEDKEAFRQSIIEALARIEVPLKMLRSDLGIPHEVTLQANMGKLAKRYEKMRYTDAAAQARADKA